MARKHLGDRKEWQGKSAARGHGAEDVFHALLSMHLRGSDLKAIKKPRSLRGIYGVHEKTGQPHGILPEYEIRNRQNGKIIWVEIKRQRAQGNAHERACKYFMPGILESAREIGGHHKGVVPFWLIFTDGIASHPRYRREITHWFQGHESNVLLWKSVDDHDAVLNHFEKHIRPLIE